MDLGLQGKKAFLAGSSRGLGYATARILAQEGCQLVLNGRNPNRLMTAADNLREDTRVEVHALKGDVTESEDGHRMIQEAAELLGGLDLLLTNTGGPPAGKFTDHTDQTWEKAVNLVFLSHVRLIRSSLPYLRQSGAASVLTLTSYSVKQPIPNLILSNSIRAATVGLTKSLALELGQDGIRFNSILPGWTKTERVEELLAFRAEEAGTNLEEEMDRITEECPLGRMAEPEEIGRAGAFLLSPAASYITGVMLQVDGGMVKGVL